MKKQKGITLVALVITIIVLLILAGVSIATLTGNNGILTHANNAKERTEQEEKDEKVDLAKQEDLINEYTKGIEVEQVTDENPGILEVDEKNENTYIINSIEDLVFFAYDVREGNTYEGQAVKLGLSLDFNSTKSYIDPLRTDYGKYGYDGELKELLTTGTGFKTIGENQSSDSTKNFHGIFDGEGHEIINLYINIKNYKKIGLFGINFGTIRNLGLSKVNMNIITPFETGTHVGGIAAQNARTGTIDNCFVSGNIIAKSTSTGGICGNNTGILKNCYNSCNIKAIIETDDETLSAAVGGILASMSENGRVENVYNCATIQGSINNGTIRIGGIAGQVFQGNVSNSFNVGDISLSGYNNSQLLVGGIVGKTFNGATFLDCYNTSNLMVTGSSKIINIGYICGNNISSTYTNCEYLKNENYNGIGRGTDSTVPKYDISEMPSILSIIGGNFKEDTRNINWGYPILNWQY